MDKWVDIIVGVVLALFTGVLAVFGWLLKAVYPTRDQMNKAIDSAVEDVERRDDAKDALLIEAVEAKVKAQNELLNRIDLKLDGLISHLLNQRR